MTTWILMVLLNAYEIFGFKEKPISWKTYSTAIKKKEKMLWRNFTKAKCKITWGIWIFGYPSLATQFSGVNSASLICKRKMKHSKVEKGQKMKEREWLDSHIYFFMGLRYLCFCLLLLQHWFSLVVAVTVSGLLEAYTTQLDNAFIPLVFYSLLCL